MRQNPALLFLRACVLWPRVFCHCQYAAAYLGGAQWCALSALHYCIVGRRRGLLPNPFFDPSYFATQSGTRSLFAYLARAQLWEMRTASHFDPAWYRRESNIPPSFNPLADFWLRGFDKRYSPAPQVDMHFFRDAVCRDQWNDRRHAFIVFAEKDRTVPLNKSDLRQTQDRFIRSISYQIVKRPEAQRRNLVFVQAGAAFDASRFALPRDFDLLLNFYETPASVPVEAEAAIFQNGTKVTSISQILRRDPDLLLRYDAVLFLDDDVVIAPDAIEMLFENFEAEGLDLAQPALTTRSSCYFSCLKQPQAGGNVRRLNAVEIMMPLVSRRVLENFGWVFDEAIGGWGVDLLLSAKVREAYGDTIAVVGSVVAAHERAVDTVDGAYYNFLRAAGIDATVEAGRIIRDHDLRSDIYPI